MILVRKTLALLIIIAGGIMMSYTNACGEDGPVSVEVDPKSVICQEFMGFGVEWDSANYNASGVTDADFAVIRSRVEWMRLPIARIMMQSKWCYKGNGRFEWDDPQMKALYRHLDVCQKLGTTVVLTDWGIEPSWLKTPDVAKVEDPKYAEIIATYMDHLLNTKGYTCITYFIMVNEPNLEVKDWDRWKAGVRNVSAAFHKKGLEAKITFMGSDQSEGDDWHTKAVDQLQDTLGAYDIHRYAPEDMARTGALFNYYKGQWAYALAKDPKAKSKPFIVGEAGFSSPGGNAGHNPLNMEPRYGILMSDYAVQAVNAGSWAVLAWMLDDNSHQGFTWGMWKNRAEALALKPWFYTWSLMSRCFRPGMRIVEATVASADVRVLAACGERSTGEHSWAFCIVNRADAPKPLRLHVAGGPRVALDRYVFSTTSAKTDKEGFPVAAGTLPGDLDAGMAFTCEANSVTIISSGDESKARSRDR